MSDLYSPSKVIVYSCVFLLSEILEIAFVAGAAGLAVLSIVGGFVQEKIGLIVIRALLGICSSYSAVIARKIYTNLILRRRLHHPVRSFSCRVSIP